MEFECKYIEVGNKHLFSYLCIDYYRFQWISQSYHRQVGPFDWSVVQIYPRNQFSKINLVSNMLECKSNPVAQIFHGPLEQVDNQADLSRG